MITKKVRIVIPLDRFQDMRDYAKSCTNSSYIMECELIEDFDEPKVAPETQIEWEKQIDEWFAPRELYEFDFNEKGKKEYTYNGIRFKDLVKDFIRDEVIKKFGEEIAEEFYSKTSSTINLEGAIDIVLKRWGIK
jgi:hypothetical protein